MLFSYLITLMDIVVNELKQKPHNVPQDEGGDQIPVDDVSETSYAPKPQDKWACLRAMHRANISMVVQIFFHALKQNNHAKLLYPK